MLRILSLAVLVAIPAFTLADSPSRLQTTAEATNYTRTTTSGDVVQFCESLAKQFPNTVTYTTYGKSHEGKPLPLLVIADAGETPKTAVLAYANIHAGEVDGKEAVLALARDLAGEKGAAIRKSLTVLIAPNINPDGNDKISGKNRTEQNGPPEVGVRQNSQGMDLNRDFVKLESPEIRALMKLLNERNPLLVVDCHTTNGSKHRYTVTYDGPRYAAVDAGLVRFTREVALPAIADKVKKATGFDSFDYGIMSRDGSKWESYPGTPRYGTQCLAMRNRLALLSESYTYASFQDRVKASEAFVRAAFEFAAEHLDELKKCVADAEKPHDKVVLKTKLSPYEKPVTILAFGPDGSTPKDVPTSFVARSEVVTEVDRPAAYLIPKRLEAAVQTLIRHGIRVEEIREDLKNVPVEVYKLSDVRLSRSGYDAKATPSFDATRESQSRGVSPGDYLVRTAQPLGNLAAYFLEPQSEDGFATWNLLGDLKVGGEFPISRLKSDAIFTGAPAPLPEDVKEKKLVTPEVFYAQRPFGMGGGFGAVTWLPDGEHWLQVKGTSLQKVNAVTGESVPAFDVEAFKKSLATIADLDRQQSQMLTRGLGLKTDAERTGTLLTAKDDLWFAYFDGKPAIRLTRGGGAREFVTLSPKGTHIVFVRKGNLFAVDFKTQTETQLTTDGGANEILNGRGDWVYEEEIFNRNGQAYWWSPDGTRIAFLRFDDTPVKKYTIAKPFPARGEAEVYGYPKPGDPNPIVKLGVVNVAEGKPNFLDLGERDPKDTLISHVGWTPKGEVYAYVQNRIQTWLDFTVWHDDKPTVLFRDQTKAWIAEVPEAKFLPDGSYLFLSERDGYRHVYHYAADGKLIRQVSKGDWEVKSIDRVDCKTCDLYCTSTFESPNGANLLRIKMTDGKVERLTKGNGTHAVSLAPVGELYVDRFSDSNTPQSVTLRRFGGESVRKLDATPAGGDRNEYKLGKYERSQIVLEDGVKLEAAVTYPPDFDAKKKYPVWVLTYAGPHAPTIKDAYSGRMFEQVLAGMGIVVLRVDPRSASGKGATYSWACYKRLGVQELKDLESAVDWICKNDWADKSRVGISGHSYGGFITAYALTHSKKFSAGIAGAPVTDWRLYDSIYTERYMGLPSENTKGYDETSCVTAAKNLHGKLLIIHGLIDDNVHFQNAMQFADALQRANKPFEIMVYPRARHGIGGRHYQELQFDFIKRTMLK